MVAFAAPVGGSFSSARRLYRRISGRFHRTQTDGVRDGIVHLRLHGTCGSCPSSSATLKNAVEDALFEVAPDIVEIVSENAADTAQSGRQLVTIK